MIKSLTADKASWVRGLDQSVAIIVFKCRDPTFCVRDFDWVAVVIVRDGGRVALCVDNSDHAIQRIVLIASRVAVRVRDKRVVSNGIIRICRACLERICFA